jgi:hypothetical protein
MRKKGAIGSWPLTWTRETPLLIHFSRGAKRARAPGFRQAPVSSSTANGRLRYDLSCTDRKLSHSGWRYSCLVCNRSLRTFHCEFECRHMATTIVSEFLMSAYGTDERRKPLYLDDTVFRRYQTLPCTQGFNKKGVADHGKTSIRLYVV